MKKILLLLMLCMLFMSMSGCVYKNRGEYLGKVAQSEDKQSDAMMQSIIDALETQDKDALKALLSPYALEHAEDLDEKIEELMEFYPGSEGGFDGYNVSKKSANYGVISLMLDGVYDVSSNGEEYEVNFVMYPRNDEEPEKIGLYLIEVMTEEAKPEGFKWKNEEDAPGIYVLE